MTKELRLVCNHNLIGFLSGQFVILNISHTLFFTFTQPSSIKMVEASLVNLAELGVLVVGVVIALFQLQGIKKTRQAELFMPIYSRFQEKEFSKHLMDFLYNWEWESPEDFMEKYGLENLEDLSSFLSIGAFYHSVGALLMNDQIDMKLVNTFKGYHRGSVSKDEELSAHILGSGNSSTLLEHWSMGW